MRVILILILLSLGLKSHEQNIETFYHKNNLDGVYYRDTNYVFRFDSTKTRFIRLNPSLVLFADTSLSNYDTCSGCQYISLYDREGYLLLEIDVSKDGNIRYFRQFSQNSIQFRYESKMDKLLYIHYMDNKRKSKYIKLK
jgi:hypothetical protein